MTKPARGVFRAISSFARYVTPSAPGSLSISTSQHPSSLVSNQATPDSSSPISEPLAMQDSPVTSSPPQFLTPAGSTTDLRHTARATESPPALPYVDFNLASSARPHSRRPRFDILSRQNSASSPKRHSTSDGFETVLPSHLRQSTIAPSGDDAGPRFWEDANEADNRALPGFAGHPDVYRGFNVNDSPFLRMLH